MSEAQKEMRELGGLELALHQLYLSWQRPEGVGVCWPLVKASCGLVRNLVADEENHDALVRFKAIPRLGQILALAAKEDRKVSNEPSQEMLRSLVRSFKIAPRGDCFRQWQWGDPYFRPHLPQLTA